MLKILFFSGLIYLLFIHEEDRGIITYTNIVSKKEFVHLFLFLAFLFFSDAGHFRLYFGPRDSHLLVRGRAAVEEDAFLAMVCTNTEDLTFIGHWFLFLIRGAFLSEILCNANTFRSTANLTWDGRSTKRES